MQYGARCDIVSSSLFVVCVILLKPECSRITESEKKFPKETIKDIVLYGIAYSTFLKKSTMDAAYKAMNHVYCSNIIQQSLHNITL